MSDNSSSSSSGIGFSGFLTLLFIGLKLTGYVDWPWIWVLAPFWIVLSIKLVVSLAIAGLIIFVEARKK